jgi:hypothetical protein
MSKILIQVMTNSRTRPHFSSMKHEATVFGGFFVIIWQTSFETIIDILKK